MTVSFYAVCFGRIQFHSLVMKTHLRIEEDLRFISFLSEEIAKVPCGGNVFGLILKSPIPEVFMSLVDRVQGK